MSDATISTQSVTIDKDGNIQLTGRHPSTSHFVPLFAFGHLPEELQDISGIFADAACMVIGACKDGPELSACLRKLLEAKDCAVRAAPL